MAAFSVAAPANPPGRQCERLSPQQNAGLRPAMRPPVDPSRSLHSHRIPGFTACTSQAAVSELVRLRCVNLARVPDVKQRRRLRRLVPDQELIRRRAAGEPLRLAFDYDVAHTTLGRYFERPEVAKKLRQAAKQLRAEQRAAARRRSARRRVEQQVRRKARATGRGRAQAGARGPRTILRGDRSARDRGRQIPPLELEPFSDDWLAWYAERRLRSQIDLLNYNDAFRGIVPPLERRARERAQPSLGKPRGRQ
jgi:hypothetical protein